MITAAFGSSSINNSSGIISNSSKTISHSSVRYEARKELISRGSITPGIASASSQGDNMSGNNPRSARKLLPPDLQDEVLVLPTIRKLIKEQRSSRENLVQDLLRSISEREKLLENLHFLQSLRSFVDDPPIAPTQRLATQARPPNTNHVSAFTITINI